MSETTNIVAWWGAIVSTALLFWDGYKWRESRRTAITVTASPNMQSLNEAIGRPGTQKYIFVEAVNNGDRPTTITGLIVKSYRGFGAKLIGKTDKEGFIARHDLGTGVPHRLEIGARWTGLIDQDDALAKLTKGGRIYVGVMHTASKKPVLTRVKVDDISG